MAAYTLLLLILVIISKCESQQRGVQLRITEKGFKYAVEIGTNILKQDLLKTEINAKGASGKVSYSINNFRITSVKLSSVQLLPIKNVGMQGLFSGISLSGNGRVHYQYRSWIKFKDTINVDFSAENMAATLTLNIGADKSGHPTVDLVYCSADVDSIRLKFHGGKSWLYNLFSKLISKKLKSRFRKMICTLIKKEIDENAKSELETFPVTKKLDRYGEIDYHLTSPPMFTSEFMDVFLKGEFKSTQNPKESSLIVPSFVTNSDDENMVYIWLSEYTINTAGEVYQASNMLNFNFEQWDPKTPKQLRNLLNTGKFILLFPKLETEYPNLPMSVQVTSFDRPRVIINEAKFELYLYAHMVFNVKDKSGKVDEVFCIRFNLTAGVLLEMKGDMVTGKITDFDYDGKVYQSNIGDITISLDNPFVKIFLKHTVISKANPILQKGFPLPNLNRVSFKEMTIKQEKGVIRIGSDVVYSR